MMKKIAEHNSWELSMRKSADDAVTTLLDSPDLDFDFTNVFQSRCSIKCSVCVIPDFFKFIIHKYGVDVETCTSICIHDPMK